jgi:hypothetical protein
MIQATTPQSAVLGRKAQWYQWGKTGPPASFVLLASAMEMQKGEETDWPLQNQNREDTDSRNFKAPTNLIARCRPAAVAGHQLISVDVLRLSESPIRQRYTSLPATA